MVGRRRASALSDATLRCVRSRGQWLWEKGPGLLVDWLAARRGSCGLDLGVQDHEDKIGWERRWGGSHPGLVAM